ncbi:phospho-N-acetylmuramoyl-pentapeptide-transferase [Limnochorda pilosa]|uniref:Phospho-N-acetylmuramoyl-pentapeptide-transferase n=1 Tax=Limnochorda pilosa TaxID=1555112 RepID=A0A0K2SLL6_LIMPI|nr:phospho-N-acetylmuramoyl-pentapeptide-transferase [Limnochorda pilosa]BAS27709.1 phospho-N-acetylmuramoyl-pentapeptide-transferase [Limnochorda pilosa]
MSPELRVLVGAGASLGLVLLFERPLIGYLRRHQVGQRIRSEGPRRHQEKAGIPTMGGLVVLLAAAAVSLLVGPVTEPLLMALLVTLGYGAIGFLDDYRKVALRRSLGLRAREKLVGQAFFALLVALFHLTRVGESASILVPFSREPWLVPAGLLLTLDFVAVVGSANAVNLTDGLDGLAAGSTAVASAILAGVMLHQGAPDLAILAAAVGAAALGFLWFNAHPAQIFMGDTGSLGLGAALAAVTVLSGTVLLLPLVGVLFVAEALSVIAQVVYFRLTRGRRLLRMSPLHHHFELLGWQEDQVVARFWIAALVGGVLGLAAVPGILW